MTDEVNGYKEERMKVLIADDEPLAVERLSRLVTQMGHEVIATAHHGHDPRTPEILRSPLRYVRLAGVERPHGRCCQDA